LLLCVRHDSSRVMVPLLDISLSVSAKREMLPVDTGSGSMWRPVPSCHGNAFISLTRQSETQ
jgi:hypothetical protein